MNSPALPSRPLTIGDLLDWTIRIYRARFGKLILTTAIFLVPVGLISGFISGQAMTGYLNILLSVLENPNIFPEEQLMNTMTARQDTLSTLSCLIMPLSLVTTGIVSLALTHHTLKALHNQEATIVESIKTGWQRFWSWLGMTVTMTIAFIGIVIATMIVVGIGGFVLALVFGGVIGSLGDLPSGNGVAAGIGVVCAVFCLYGLVLAAIFGPVAYFYGRWAVAIPGIVDQRWGAIESLQESWALTRGNVWRCVGYMVLLFLLYGVIYLALMALGFGLASLVVTTSSLASMAVFAIIGAVLPVLWQPLQMAAQVMLYHDLRIRNESYDLEMQISQLETEVAPDELPRF